MSTLTSLESNLNNIFGKSAPALPPKGKKFIVQYLPWISLILGLLSLYTAWVLWHWAHLTNNLINSLNQAYGISVTAPLHRLSVGIWLGLVVLAIEGLIYIAAFPGTRDRKKSGWNLLFYGALINIVYGVIMLFTSYGGVSNLLFTLIGAAIGFYFLFQIRSAYTKQPVGASHA